MTDFQICISVTLNKKAKLEAQQTRIKTKMAAVNKKLKL